MVMQTDATRQEQAEARSLAIIKVNKNVSVRLLAFAVTHIPDRSTMRSLVTQAATIAAEARATAAVPAGLAPFEACVISREDPEHILNIMNSTGHYGLFQFSEQTWIVNNAMATADGADNWTPYDGCVYVPAAPAPVVVTAAPVVTPATGFYSALDEAAYNWALGRAGIPYVWGGTGPSGYDCSSTRRTWPRARPSRVTRMRCWPQ
jgi:cell wall-associated NlpC family hydrolase